MNNLNCKYGHSRIRALDSSVRLTFNVTTKKNCGDDDDGDDDDKWSCQLRRQALYAPSSSKLNQKISDYDLNELTMPSVSFSEEQDFRDRVDHNSNMITELFLLDVDITLDNKDDARCTDSNSKLANPKENEMTSREKDDHSRFESKVPEIDDVEISLEPRRSESVLGLGSACPLGTSAYKNQSDEDGLSCLSQTSKSSPSPDQASDKENVRFDAIEDPYSMHSLHDSLPKLKVTTPACLHNEDSGAFKSYSKTESAEPSSSWQQADRRSSLLQSDRMSIADSDHDASCCSIDSAVTVSSVESLPRVFYDPKVHCGCHLSAVSVPPRRRAFQSGSENGQISDRVAGVTDRDDWKSVMRPRCANCRDAVADASASTPEAKCKRNVSTSSKSRFLPTTRSEQFPSKAMMKLVFPSPSKSSSLSDIHPRLVSGGNTDAAAPNECSSLYGKRLQNLIASSRPGDTVDPKRKCQRSVTPLISRMDAPVDRKTERHSKSNLQSRLNSSLSGSSVPREHRLGISGKTPLNPNANPHRVSSLDGIVRRASHCHDHLSTATEFSKQIGSRKRLNSSPGKFVGKKLALSSLPLSSPLGKRNPLLLKLSNVPPSVAGDGEEKEFSDDQLDAVTLKNTILNRGRKTNKKDFVLSPDNQITIWIPSRVKWRLGLVANEPEIQKSPLAAAASKSKKSILNRNSLNV